MKRSVITLSFEDQQLIAEMWVHALNTDVSMYYHMKSRVKQIVSFGDYLLIGLITDKLYRQKYIKEVA